MPKPWIEIPEHSPQSVEIIFMQRPVVADTLGNCLHERPEFPGFDRANSLWDTVSV